MTVASPSHAASIKCTYRLWFCFYLMASNQIMWQREVSVTEMHCGYVWCDLSSRKSACSIPVHYQSKPEIVSSRTWVFSCPLKKNPRIMFCFVLFLVPISKVSFMRRSLPILRPKTHPSKAAKRFPQWHENTFCFFLPIPWKQCKKLLHFVLK